MKSNNEPREIVRRIQDGDVEWGFPCVVSHREAVGDGGPCERPAAMTVYGLAFCEVHGEEAAAGAFEEMHQDAQDFFERFDGTGVAPLGNPLVHRALHDWLLSVPDGELVSVQRDEAALLAAYPFRADKVCSESAAELAEPIPGNEHPYDGWLDERHHIHACMRVAYEHGLPYFVEAMEGMRESVAAQAAYTLALMRGEHPEVLERAVAE